MKQKREIRWSASAGAQQYNEWLFGTERSLPGELSLFFAVHAFIFRSSLRDASKCIRMGNFNGRDVAEDCWCYAFCEFFGRSNVVVKAFLGKACTGRYRCCGIARLFCVFVEDGIGTGGIGRILCDCGGVSEPVERVF